MGLRSFENSILPATSCSAGARFHSGQSREPALPSLRLYAAAQHARAPGLRSIRAQGHTTHRQSQQARFNNMSRRFKTRLLQPSSRLSIFGTGGGHSRTAGEQQQFLFGIRRARADRWWPPGWVRLACSRQIHQLIDVAFDLPPRWLRHRDRRRAPGELSRANIDGRILGHAAADDLNHLRLGLRGSVGLDDAFFARGELGYTF